MEDENNKDKTGYYFFYLSLSNISTELYLDSLNFTTLTNSKIDEYIKEIQDH